MTKLLTRLALELKNYNFDNAGDGPNRTIQHRWSQWPEICHVLCETVQFWRNERRTSWNLSDGKTLYKIAYAMRASMRFSSTVA